MNIGQADQDYHGEKEPEEDVTDQTEIKLDYSARSLIFNLRTEAENVSRIELVPARARHRVPVEQIEIYYKRWETDFFYTKLERSAWTGSKDEQGRIIIKFNPVLKASMLKVHCNYDDLDLWQLPVDRAEFFNTPEQLATVYQKLVTRTESYAYDAMGNRTTERILLRKEYGYTYTYYPNSNRLKSKEKADGTERVDYEYDPNGNLTVKVVTKEETVIRWEYSYDLLNQLEEVKKNGEVVSTYTYDPNGFRVEKVGSKGKIHYVPLLNGEVGYRKEFSSNSEYSFIYVGGQHFARVDGVIGGEGKKYFYHNDHLGSALAVTDEQGNKVVERDFTPFGERINVDIYDETNRDPAEDDSGFTGKDWDADIELYYFNARWYDSELGRFISVDPAKDGVNWYTYCSNNPLTRIDPTGESWLTDVGEKIGNYFQGRGFKTNATIQQENIIKENQQKLDNLKAGISGNQDVIKAQACLSLMNFPIGNTGNNGVDGQIGSMTKGAIRAFQRMSGLEVTGELNEETLFALNQAATSGKTIRDLAMSAHERGVEFEISKNSSRADFVNAVYYYAILDEEKTGVPAAITTAQAILESYYGRSVPTDINTKKYSYNLFGVKGKGIAGSVQVWTKEEINGEMVKVKDYFRAYNNFGESIMDHSAFLMKYPRYKSLFETRDPIQWARGLQKAGYATDSQYANKLINIMNQWGLK